VFRDSHKFVALLGLAYAYFGAFGLQSLLRSVSPTRLWAERLLSTAGVLVLIIPLIYALPMFGAWGQVRPTSYPAEWSEVRSLLNRDEGDYNLLVLPWHMYMDFPWLPNRWKRLANPAPNFFAQMTISGDNLEIAGSRSNSSNPVSEYVEALLTHREAVRNFGSLITPLNARYVVLFKASDYQSYGFLRRQKDLELVFEGETIILFRNLHPTAKAYAVNEITRVKSLTDYLRLYPSQEPLEHLYVLGSGSAGLPSADPPKSETVTQPKVVGINPVSYRVEDGDGSYLVLTLPQATVRGGWEYRGESGLLNLDMMPAFQLDPGDGTITFSRFYSLYLLTYALAAASLIACTFVYLRWR